jgi:hypothetical protein
MIFTSNIHSGWLTKATDRKIQASDGVTHTIHRASSVVLPFCLAVDREVENQSEAVYVSHHVHGPYFWTRERKQGITLTSENESLPICLQKSLAIAIQITTPFAQ